MRTFVCLALTAFAFTRAQAAVQTRAVEYKDGDTVLEGFLAFDDAKVKADGAKAPGVLIIHQWLGLTDNEKMRARMLAELGYVAFAADIYGKGVRPKDRLEAPKFADLQGDRVYRQRLNLGLEQSKKQPGSTARPRRARLLLRRHGRPSWRGAAPTCAASELHGA
jgi:dienelactone hydrolase